jgi:thiamine kinase-like enzyme
MEGIIELQNHEAVISHLKHNNIHNTVRISFEHLNGLSNEIYKVTVFDACDKKLIEFVFRLFGRISDVLDRKLESMIINSLPGYTPVIYDTDDHTYRIEEYIHDATELHYQNLFDKNVIDKIVKILTSYSQILGVYKYSLNSVRDEYELNIESSDADNNTYSMCIDKMLKKGRKNFVVFKDLVDEKISNYVDNFEMYYNTLFPKNSLFVLNHNDIHRLNILVRKNDDLILLDHEYASLNLIGSDIVNYMIESNFDYEKYSFGKDLDFNKYYTTYTEFLDVFQVAHSETLKDEHLNRLFKKCYKYKYMLKIVCIISLFWFVYCIIYLNVQNLHSTNHFNFAQHSLDRLFVFEKAYEEINKIDNCN